MDPIAKLLTVIGLRRLKRWLQSRRPRGQHERGNGKHSRPEDRPP